MSDRDAYLLLRRIEGVRKSTGRTTGRRIRAQGRLRQRVRELEERLEESRLAFAALVSLLEARGGVTQDELVAELETLRAADAGQEGAG